MPTNEPTGELVFLPEREPNVSDASSFIPPVLPVGSKYDWQPAHVHEFCPIVNRAILFDPMPPGPDAAAESVSLSTLPSHPESVTCCPIGVPRGIGRLGINLWGHVDID
eukprot:3273194-Rhodomonas_salina.1